MKSVEFFLPMRPPTATAQEHKLDTRGKRPRVYDPPAVREARAKLTAHLAAHAPQEPFAGAVLLHTKWCFPICGKHKDGEYRTSRPDITNLQKLFEDCMEEAIQVRREAEEKYFGDMSSAKSRSGQ